jgi:hypothetical protein
MIVAALAARHAEIEAQVKAGLSVIKIGVLLECAASWCPTG